MTINFETYWEKIGGDIHFASRKEATEREWARHPDKHKAVILWLVEHGRYPRRNPFFFIQDFKVQQPKAQPTNYRGKTIPGGMRVYSAKWNGAWGMYTEEDIEAYQMERYVDVVSHTTTMDERSGDKNIAEVQNI